MNPFSGELVTLSPLRREDLPTYTRWFQDYEVQRLLMPEVLVPFTSETEETWYESASRQSNGYTFGIRTCSDDKLIGNCSLFEISQKNRSATFGIVLGEKDYWGRGYGTEATKLMIQFGFDELNLNRIQLEVYDFNPRARRAYEKAGFCREGLKRQALYREGRYWDIELMAILRDEWRASM